MKQCKKQKYKYYFDKSKSAYKYILVIADTKQNIYRGGTQFGCHLRNMKYSTEPLYFIKYFTLPFFLQAVLSLILSTGDAYLQQAEPLVTPTRTSSRSHSLCPVFPLKGVSQRFQCLLETMPTRKLKDKFRK